jgi:hypothetical protein
VVNRLDAIIERNQKPARKSLRSNFAFGVRSIFLLIILAMLFFTKWAIPPKDDRPGINVVPPATNVHGVKLWKAPTKK